MSVQDDLLNEKNNAKSDEFIEVAPECNAGCSFWNSEPENEYSFLQNWARGDNSCTTSERYVKILDFRHFERHFMFSRETENTRKNNFRWCE
ncbi:MAG: hypothetical protein ACERKN_20275 [Velocimicrobium sp.]